MPILKEIGKFIFGDFFMKKLSLFLIGLFFIVLSGCSSSAGNGDFMPITEENMNEYFNGMADAKKSISVGEDVVSSAIKQYKEPLEDMGYDFDATLLNTIIALQNAGYTNASTMATSFVNHTTYFIQNNPQKSVDGGFVTEDTKDKILMYLKFKEMKPKTIQALKFVEKCQDEHSGICPINFYVKILLNNNLLNFSARDSKTQNAIKSLTADNLFLNENRSIVSQVEYDFENQINYQELGKYLIHNNGGKVNTNGFFASYTKPFKLKESATKELENYDPWWTK